MEDNKTTGAGESLDASNDQNDTTPEQSKQDESPKKKKRGSLLTAITNRFNIYLLAFIFIVIISIIIIFVVIQSSSKQAEQQQAVETQELTQEAVDQLTGNEATVGDPKQLLSIESNAVFAGKVLIRDGLDVAGPIKVGGDLSLPGITVSGKSAFDEVQVNSLSIAGDTSVQGTLSVEQNITVSGQGSFGGPLSAPSIIVDALQLSGDLQFARHIDAGGGTPSVSAGGAVGSGGTVTLSGTDTAGTVTVNIGSGGAAGNLATISFAAKFNETPHVVFSPVGNAAPNVYITNRSSSGFTLTTSSAFSSGSISFDYIAID